MQRCPACPGPPFSIVPSDGPAPAPVLLLGAGPAKTEHRTGKPYSGLAGDELNETYLPLARLPRETAHVANASRCWDGSDRTPPEKRIRECAACHLPALLDRVDPTVVVLMGGVTQRIADQRIRLDMMHGIPQHGSLLNGTWEGYIWPSYEPALGMRETARMEQLLTDFTHLGEWMRGEWTPPVAEETEKDYALCDTPGDWGRYILADYPKRWTATVALDTEKHGSRPWSIQISKATNTGRMLRSDSKAFGLLNHYLSLSNSPVVLHNAPQDLDTLDRMGVHVTNYRDTMQEAYHLCSLPQGLKPLAYRLLGVTMRSWEDVVWPASVAAAVCWMDDAILLARDGLSDAEVTLYKMKTCADCGKRGKADVCKHCGSSAMVGRKVERVSSAAEAVLQHVRRYTLQTQEADEPYNPWEKLAEMQVGGLRGKKAEAWEWQYLEYELGPVPILGIGNCELEEAVRYGCGDADMTGQVAAVLEKERGAEKWQVAQEDWDQ